MDDSEGPAGQHLEYNVRCPLAPRGFLTRPSKLPFDSTFSRCGVGHRRVVSTQGINRLFHLKAREPFDVARHVSRCIHASSSATSRITLPAPDHLRTGIVFLLHAANKRLLGARAKYTSRSDAGLVKGLWA